MGCRALLAVVVVVAAAAVAAPYDPGAAGHHAVGSTTLALADESRGRTLVTEVWYPATRPERDAPPRPGRFPLVLLAHGFCGFRTNYSYLATHLAGRGFLVAAPDFPGFNAGACAAGSPAGLVDEPAADLRFLRAALHEGTGPAARFARRVRGRRTGLVGHSLGGLAVVNAALVEPAFAAVVALAALVGRPQGAPFAALARPPAILLLAGAADTLLPPAGFAGAFFAAAGPPAFLVEVAGGTHSGFADRDGGLAPAALARQQALTRRYATALLERYVRRVRAAARVLTPADAAEQGGAVTLEARP